ncbi:hypothetical protein [Tessaracoccus sp.]
MSMGTLHLVTTQGDLDLCMESGAAWVTVEGFSVPIGAEDLLLVASWLLEAYPATDGFPPRGLVNPTAARVAHALELLRSLT